MIANNSPCNQENWRPNAYGIANTNNEVRPTQKHQSPLSVQGVSAECRLLTWLKIISVKILSSTIVTTIISNPLGPAEVGATSLSMTERSLTPLGQRLRALPVRTAS